ncbi:unnamed protein product (macronuclear) [Paramecium tetraurelia]|uniref:Pop1 N-terminal domain-containing protein n=1 Tax=Paramecium tetraurelia TaxID=5888 RepID=A0D8X4_PARTE|nr:uncharacterized protein GSPATT00014437001 [Paramecium tetraurelia]CAK79491.1 unnamed protein product [Paramecium tetraurelia]|eukprot:XP_001446888.1 hypothetical protein (macronuclear) [Paramecium tetraurelia strain d4-2]
MIHQNLVFGNLITSNQLEWLVKKQKILLKSPQDMNEKKTKPKRLFRSTSFKTEQHALLLSNPKNNQTKSPMLLKPRIEKNGLRKLPSKPNPSDEQGKSEKSITSSQRRSSALQIKIKRRWSYLQIQGEKYKRLNNKAPKNIIKYHYVTAEKEKKKKLNRLRMQYKFISRLQKNKFRKLRSKTLPLSQFIRMRHTRAKTFAEDQHQGPILNLEESLKRKINMLVVLRKSAMRRHTCFQMPKKSVLVSKEKLINYQKQISDKLVKTESQVEFSPALDQILVYQRRVNFTDLKQSFKIAQQKKKCFLSGQFKKKSHSIITSYISNKAVTQNSEYQSLLLKPLNQLIEKKTQTVREKNTNHQSWSDRSLMKRRPNLLLKLQPYLSKQVIVKC